MFSGFSDQTFRFLKDLGRNNDKAWFDANRDAYEAHYLEPAKAFVAAMEAPLKAIAPEINAEPRVNGSIFRINRDIRFSKDKTPYKDHLDLWFWEGERKTAVSSFFFRLTAMTLILGAGAHQFPPDRLKRYRESVDDAAARRQLVKAIDAARDGGLEIGGEHYRKPPRGFSPADETAERLLRHNALYCHVETPHPAAVRTDGLVDHCAGIWRNAAPLHHWLIDNVAG